jgi:hypothetical protein
MALIDDALGVCLGSQCGCAIRIPGEVSPKMIGDLPNSLKLRAVTSEFLKEEARMMYNSQIVHINANKLIMSATILHPNIRIGPLQQGNNPMSMSVSANNSCPLAPLVQSS